MMRKILYILLFILLALVFVYIIGPKPNYPDIDPKINTLSIPIEKLDDYITQQEKKVKDLRPNNEARIVWYKDKIEKTPYSIVYLHGFSAGTMEADPVSFKIAEKYGANMFLARIKDHGRSSIESFVDLSPSDMIESAKEAIAIGHLIGEKVIVMSCSTGSTLSIFLDAHNPSLIDAMVMYSPNIELYDSKSQLAIKPWGLQILRQVFGSNYRSIEMEEGAKPFWTTKYRLEGIVALTSLLNETMTTDVFVKVKSPYLMAYYYEDDEKQDKVISTEAIKEFHKANSTPENLKKRVPLASVKSHVIANKHQSKDWQSVQKVTEQFLEEVLDMKAVN